MARRELAFNLEAVCPMYPTSPEQWAELYRNPAFLQVLSDLKALHLRLLDKAQSYRIPDEIQAYALQALGVKEALKEIQISEDRALQRAFKDNRDERP